MKNDSTGRRPGPRRTGVSPSSTQPRPPASPEDGMLRLNKAIALAGVASRRAADERIQEGRVSVNGVTVCEPGTKINPATDSVVVDGITLALPACNAKNTYLMLHKPIQVVSTTRDPQGRKTVLDCLPEQYREKRLFPVGRLDYFSEGLLLLTDDGELTLRLTHPRYHQPKTYFVRVRETPSQSILATMRQGMTLAEGERLAPTEVALVSSSEPVLRVTLLQGVNRQIRRMCRDLGLTILSLQRVASGPLHLGELPKGAVRELSAQELEALRKSVGL